MATGEGKKALADSGLRPVDGSRTPEQAGVGSVAALKPASPESVERALKGWSLRAIPFRSLVVMDVSGSMNFQAGEQTRMQLTQQAAIAGSKLFPDTAALGMWAFSIGLGGGSQDYVELDPIRKTRTPSASRNSSKPSSANGTPPGLWWLSASASPRMRMPRPSGRLQSHRRHQLCCEEFGGHPERFRGCAAGSRTQFPWPTAASGAFRDLKM